MTRKRRHSLEPHPAPEGLRTVQAFLDSVRVGDQDELASPETLAKWLVRRKLVPRGTTVDEDAWRSAVATRDGLRALVRGHTGLGVDRKAVDRLDEELARVRPRLRLDARRRIRADAADDQNGWAGAQARLVLAVFEAMRTDRWERFKLCHEKTCRRVFYDASRSRTGKWCTVRRCGNRLHTKNYRRRGGLKGSSIR